jgi:hypothetical protein
MSSPSLLVWVSASVDEAIAANRADAERYLEAAGAAIRSGLIRLAGAWCTHEARTLRDAVEPRGTFDLVVLTQLVRMLQHHGDGSLAVKEAFAVWRSLKTVWLDNIERLLEGEEAVRIDDAIAQRAREKRLRREPTLHGVFDEELLAKVDYVRSIFDHQHVPEENERIDALLKNGDVTELRRYVKARLLEHERGLDRARRERRVNARLDACKEGFALSRQSMLERMASLTHDERETLAEDLSSIEAAVKSMESREPVDAPALTDLLASSMVRLNGTLREISQRRVEAEEQRIRDTTLALLRKHGYADIGEPQTLLPADIRQRFLHEGEPLAELDPR